MLQVDAIDLSLLIGFVVTGALIYLILNLASGSEAFKQAWQLARGTGI